jgi:FKBP12-rapamycin complex-associated protein
MSSGARVLSQKQVDWRGKRAPLCFDHSTQMTARIRILILILLFSRLMIQHRLYFAYVNHLWFTERRQEAMTRLRPLCDVVDMVSHFERVDDTSLRVNCWLELGEWKLSDVSSRSSFISDELQADVLAAFQRATLFEDCGYKPWHAWALLNFRIALQSSDGDEAGHVGEGRGTNAVSDKVLRNHVVAAVKGFVTAISLGTRKWCASVQQDLLNLLTCLFKYGDLKDVAAVINDCIGSIEIEAWLGVLPQLLARIHIKEPCIRSVLHPLLIRLGEKHPQALMYPLSVLLKSPVAERKSAAESLMNSLKAHSSEIVEEALMVSSELIRVAILWLETWHEGLEDASRLYFGEGNTSGMLDLLLPLHEKLERGPETQRESDFLKSFGQDLAQAHRHIKEYIRLVAEGGYNIPTRPGSSSGVVDLSRPSEEAETSINKAWDIYYTCFRRINKQLPSLTKLELTQCSPALSRARSLELGVPGSYRVDGSYVKIEKFVPSVDVITSKQRPRKITLRGRDGKDYVFLLKGHEDLRQDERVMQLFGLVNALLVRDPQTKKHDLKIQRYAISPLSHNCGLVGWVPNTETLHSLLRDFRSAKKIPLNMENREMVKISPDYDLLTVMQKVEVFTEALQKTSGQGSDLYEILWLKSTTSEEWLERRTKFTRSLAVMSIVGYILGLGDRHPSNLMLDKLSGRILHIDFGDCFEVAMNRDKYPEKVPFRLTRMLVKAMEVSGIEGSYRSTCERTMSVLRDSRDSLVAMLEAFVYDPLISWRLADLSPGGSERATSLHDAARPVRGGMPLSSNNDVSGVPIELSGRSMIPDPIREHPDEDGEDEDEQGNESVPEDMNGLPSLPQRRTVRDGGMSTSRARSLQMYKSIQTLAANLTTDSRITSVAGGDPDQHVAAEGSIASSRIERSMKQRELLSLLGGKDGAAHEEALNEKALKVIRRVQDKLTGTDFPDCNDEPLDVTDQVQRLVVQATSRENLCQLFIGWCAFW